MRGGVMGSPRNLGEDVHGLRGAEVFSMQHPRTLPAVQQQHLAAACRRTSVARVASALSMSRDVITRLVAGLPCQPGSVALAQQSLPRLDAALAPSTDPPQAA